MTLKTHEIYDPGIDLDLDKFVNDLCDDALKEARRAGLSCKCSTPLIYSALAVKCLICGGSCNT